MKGILLLAAIAISAPAFANICEVDLIDLRSNRLISRIRADDFGDNCREGMKSCRFEIRQRGLHGRADCVRVEGRFPDRDNRPLPDYDPIPRPNPRPLPDYDQRPIPSSAARRLINNGETVIYANRYFRVLGVSFDGRFALQSMDGYNTISNNIPREQLSVTNGCNLGICVSETTIQTTSARYARVVALSFNDQFVTQSMDGYNVLSSNVDRRQIAETKGCVSSSYAQVCVGNQVIDQFNRYMTVVGVQLDGRVVLRSTDGYNVLSANIDPTRLVITR